MSNDLIFNNTRINDVVYNNTSVNVVKYNDTAVWGRPYTYTTGTLPTGVASITCTRATSPNAHASTSSTVANNSAVYYGDTVYFSATASSGYEAPTTSNPSSNPLSVNGNVIGAHYVSAGALSAVDILVTINSNVNSISLTYVNPSGTTVTVSTSSTQTYSAKRNTSYSWTATAKTGYTMSADSGSGTATTGMWVCPTASVTTFLWYQGTLPTGVASVYCYRVTSPLKGAPSGKILDYNYVYYGDTVYFTATASTGYNNPTVTYGSSSNTLTVTNNVIGQNYVTAGSRKSYTITFAKGGGNYGSWSPSSLTAYYGDLISRSNNTVTIYKWDATSTTRSSSTFTNGSEAGYVYSVSYNEPISPVASAQTITATTSRKESAYLKFNSSSSFTLSVKSATKTWDGVLQYSINKTTWDTWDGTTTLSSSNNVLYLRGVGNTYISQSAARTPCIFNISGSNIYIDGEIESLLDYSSVNNGTHPIMANYCYYRLFKGCVNIKSSPKLSATTLSNYCYAEMFYGCTGLTSAPALPATSLTSDCYNAMFRECSSLTSAPALPATSLSDYCYYYMFYKCISLKNAPDLSATSLTDYCYYDMFAGCTSLTSTPNLQSTSLVNRCYAYMFQGCTSLTNITSLPATSLEQYCCYFMFSNCTSLNKLPKLNATSLAKNCYQSMFSGCSNIKLSSTLTGEYTTPYRIPYSGTGTTATGALSSAFQSTGGTWTGSPEINTTYYTSNTLV